MSTRWVLRNLSSKARFLSTSTTSSYITTTTPIDFYPTPSLFATTKVLGCQGTYLCRFRAFHGATYQIHQEKNSVVEPNICRDSSGEVSDKITLWIELLNPY
ncbi:uncharacterized protein LOC113300616 isoform X1 [Papaver somniferum]|uniref:uncharacterized protein LOC113300616 isoform X1 n=1 Tax=Papaver somniferum TaxID=3469 RepID=UPI000E7059D5|nr:uncharacterized protein LOC113300616 isoform X1 [Papaver somniferum]